MEYGNIENICYFRINRIRAWTIFYDMIQSFDIHRLGIGDRGDTCRSSQGIDIELWTRVPSFRFFFCDFSLRKCQTNKNAHIADIQANDGKEENMDWATDARSS